MSLELDRTRECPLSREERDDPQRRAPALPPADRGASAWKFLVGSFMSEAVVWGIFDQSP